MSEFNTYPLLVPGSHSNNDLLVESCEDVKAGIRKSIEDAVRAGECFEFDLLPNGDAERVDNTGTTYVNEPSLQTYGEMLDDKFGSLEPLIDTGASHVLDRTPHDKRMDNIRRPTHRSY